MVPAGRVMLLIAQMLTHLSLERGLQHSLGEPAEQPVGADQLHALLPGLRYELLGEPIGIYRRSLL
jgi:hypothetical protein